MSSQSLLDERNIRTAHCELLQKIGPGTQISASAYDTAWVARLKDIDKDLSEQALGWLRKNQLPDGSWGAQTPLYYHDRVVCTLSVILALAQVGEAQDQDRISRGTGFLDTAFNTLSNDPAGETIAFELIVPALLAETEQLGIFTCKAQGPVQRWLQQREAKLATLPRKLINRHHSPAYSCEVAVHGVD
jgi:halimadienyl-diphosphate synthase